MNKSALKGDGLMAMELGGEEVACDMAGASLATPASDGGAALRGGRPKAGPPLEGVSLDRAKRFATGLAGKRIFHIGNAMKAPTVP
jgi:hypothetical protein